MTSSIEIFSALLALCAGNSPVTGEFPSQRPVTRSCNVFIDLCLNKRFSKQSRCRWFETPSRSLWRHCDESTVNSAEWSLMVWYPGALSMWPAYRLRPSLKNTPYLYLYLQIQLEQLERLRSEDTPRRLMITHTIESYWIPSQKMTKSKLQIFKIRQNFKFLKFETGITRDTPSEVAW